MARRWGEEQALIDKQVLRLQAEHDETVTGLEKALQDLKGQLNSQRNSMAPVYRLPPEVLSRIFWASLTTSQASEDALTFLNPYARIHKNSTSAQRGSLSARQYFFEYWQKGPLPDILQTCRVSQYWRTVALSSPELWNHIQVKHDTEPGLLSLIRKNAKQTPLHLDLHLCQTPMRTFVNRVFVSELLCAGAGQLKSLAICCGIMPRSNSLLSDLLQEISGRAEQLQSLEIVVNGTSNPEITKLFPSGTPKLRYLELNGCAIPWTSTYLKSPHLTHLILHSLPDFDAPRFSEFLSVLQHADQVTTLHLDLPHQETLAWDDLGSGHTDLPYELSQLETIQLVSKFAAPLLIVMACLDIDAEDLGTIKVLCGEADNNLQDICEFMGTVGHFFHLEIRYEPSGTTKGFVISCDEEAAEFIDGVLVMWPIGQPFVTMNTGQEFPFSPMGSSQYRIPWCFGLLKYIVIGEMRGATIPQAFWEELASLPSLEVVHMKWARITLVLDFFRAMVTSSKKRISPNSNPTPIFTDQGEDQRTKEPVSHPFPALRAIVFDSMESVVWNCRADVKLRYKLPPSWTHLNQFEVYIRFVVHKLRPWRDYGHRYLDHLVFRKHGPSCKNGDGKDCLNGQDPKLEEVDRGIVRSLGGLANLVSLGDIHYNMAVIREREAAHASNGPATVSGSSD